MAVCPICGEGCATCPDPRDAEIARLKARAEKAEAACAELRAALRRLCIDANRMSERPRQGTYDDDLHASVVNARALLARTDLGAGMVVVPREVVEQVRATLTRWRIGVLGWGNTIPRAYSETRDMLTILAGEMADLAVEGDVADACMSVVEQCRALVEGHACSCWRVTE